MRTFNQVDPDNQQEIREYAHRIVMGSNGRVPHGGREDRPKVVGRWLPDGSVQVGRCYEFDVGSNKPVATVTVYWGKGKPPEFDRKYMEELPAAGLLAIDASFSTFPCRLPRYHTEPCEPDHGSV